MINNFLILFLLFSLNTFGKDRGYNIIAIKIKKDSVYQFCGDCKVYICNPPPTGLIHNAIWEKEGFNLFSWSIVPNYSMVLVIKGNDTISINPFPLKSLSGLLYLSIDTFVNTKCVNVHTYDFLGQNEKLFNPSKCKQINANVFYQYSTGMPISIYKKMRSKDRIEFKHYPKVKM